MPFRWKRLSSLSVTLLGLCGCWTTDNQLKPPTPPAQYVLPPEDDPKFSQPPSFPDKTLNQNLQKRGQELDTPGVPKPSSRFGAGGGGGGPGGPGGF